MDHAPLIEAGVRWDDRIRAAADGPARAPGDPRFLEHWRRAVDPFDEGLFRRRLQLAGLDEQAAAAVFAPDVCVGLAAEVDEHVRLFEQLQAAIRLDADDVDPLEWVARIEVDDPELAEIPYAHLLWPMAEWAWGRMASAAGPQLLACCTAPAAMHLRRWLIRRLSGVITSPLLEFRPICDPTQPNSASRARYAQVVAELRADGLDEFVAAYPVAARAIGQTVELWCAAVVELLGRIVDDAELLASEYGAALPICLRGASLGAGDAHGRGRTAAVLELTGEREPVRVVLKSHDMRIEAMWAQVAQEFLELDDDQVPTRIAAIGTEYGYARFVAHRPAADAAELREFYRRSGTLLALMRVLQVSDAHAENVIACGPDLVVIDPETMLRPTLAGNPAGHPHSIGWSVLRLLLLPVWTHDPTTGGCYDLTGLGAEQTPPQAVEPCTDANTDAMRAALSLRLSADRAYAPVDPGVPIPLPAHADDLIAGFTAGYLKLLEPETRDWLRARIEACTGMHTRIVLRPSRVYANVLANSTSPAAMADPRVRACAIEVLASGAMESDVMAAAVLDAEISAIEWGDIPQLSHELGSDSLFSDGRRLPADVRLAGVDAALERLDALDADDLAWQRDLIEMSIDARWPRASAPDAPIVTGSRVADVFVEQAWQSSWPTSDGRRDWATLQPLGMVHFAAIRPVGIGAYSGLSGLIPALSIAVQAPHLDDRARDRGTQQLDAAWLRLIDWVHRIQSSRHGSERSTLELGLTGIGGVLRMLAALPERTAEQLAMVQSLIELLGSEPWPWADVRDLMRGPAACIAPLIDLAKREPELRDVDEVIASLARRIATHQWDDGGWYDPVLGRPATGMLYGASGIGLALLRAGVFLGDERSIDAGALALHFEHSLGDAGTWPEFLNPSLRAPSTWCTGSAGIGLARAAALSLLPGHRDADSWAADCAAAFDATWQVFATGSLRPSDHVCCGNLGLAASMALAGALLDDSVLRERGADASSMVLDARGAAGLLPGWSRGPRLVGSASFMTGTAGMATVLAGDRAHGVLAALLT